MTKYNWISDIFKTKLLTLNECRRRRSIDGKRYFIRLLINNKLKFYMDHINCDYLPGISILI